MTITQFECDDAACDNCDWTGRCDALDPIDDIDQRLDPGSEVPAGQCPECGALAYLAVKS